VLVAVLAVLALGVAAQPAVAKTPCWKQVIDDWHDHNGRITGTYALHCYREAIAHVPEDLRVYTGIVEDIQSARQQASRDVVRRPTAFNPNAPNSRNNSGSNSETETNAAKKRAADEPHRAVFKQAFDKLGSRNADSVPLPLLILAGLSLLLIAAGGAGLLSRRLRTRKVPG
jgi:hypothetical protein